MASASTNLWVLLGLGFAGMLLMTRKLKKAIKADFGAFIERLELLPPPQPAPPKAPHPLTGLTFAVADVFDINGYVTGFGNPDWARSHEASTDTSTVVSVLVDGGATCTGKTVVDEMCFSINGENKHFGAPTNPAATDRIAGGCSSGSAVAVACGLVDISLGIDTVGGVRVPAAYCGVLGFRPSHGVVSNSGVIPVSQSLDTVGNACPRGITKQSWLAKDPNILHRVGHVLLQLPYLDIRQPRHIIIADDCFELLKVPSSKITQVVVKSTEKIFGRQLLNHIKLGDYLAPKVRSLKQLQNGQINGEVKRSFLDSLGNAMQMLYKHEFRSNHGEWIDSVHPDLDPLVSSQMSGSLESSSESIQQYQTLRNEIRLALNAFLKDDVILVFPTLPGLPPKLGAKEIVSKEYYNSAYSLLAIAGMSGCCQVAVPIGCHEKCPVSVSFLARNGGDRFLLEVLRKLYDSLQEQAHLLSKVNSSSSIVGKEESAEIAKQKGNIAYKEKQWQKAVILYSEAIKLVSDNATYYNNRAAAYLELGSYLQAEADCSTAIGLDKKNIKAYLRRGTAREMLGFYHEAIDDFRHALVLEPTNKTASTALSRLSKLFM